MNRLLLARLRALAVAAIIGAPLTAIAPVLPAAQFDPLADLAAELGEPIEVSAAIEPGKDGGPDVVAVTATLEDGWHLYSLKQPAGGPLRTVITVAADSPRQLAGDFQPDAPPTVRNVTDIPAWKGIPIEEHAGEVTWRAPLKPGAGEVRGTVRVQLCEDTSCLPPETIAFAAKAVMATAAAEDSKPAAKLAALDHPIDRTHARLEATLGSLEVREGRQVRPLTLRLEPEPGWHLYRPADRDDAEIGEGKPTILSAGDAGDRLLTAEADAVATPELAASGGVEGPVTLRLVLEAGDPVELLVGLQTCAETACDQPTGLRIMVDPPADDTAGEVLVEPAAYREVAAAPRAFGAARRAAGEQATEPTTAGTGSVGDESGIASVTESAQLSLPLALLMGLAGGLILNLMPCVLPVLGLKLMSFAQQSGRERREVFLMNLWFCAGLFAVFFVLATASVGANLGLSSTNLGWGQQFGSVPFKIGMLGVVFAFALSFLGVWELPIPGFIGEKAGHVQSQEGPLGSFLKGVLSTVLATPCSGPFLGPVFGYTLTQPTVVTYAVFGSIALGMSLPYILVGLFPGLVKFMPKPGAWMATFKEVLGFVMLGTVAYLFYLLRQQPDWFVPTFVMLIGIWLACWWVGRAQETTGTAGFGRWLQAAAAGAAVAAAGFLWLGPHDSLINWEKPFSPARLADLRRSGSTVMVDFSADWCLTCKANLQFAIETDRVKAKLQKNRVVPMLADWTDGSDEIRRVLEGLGSRSIPVLAIYPAAKPGETPPEPIVLRDLLTESQVLAALEEAGPSCCPPPEIRAAAAPAAAGR
jgi:suppressor for copper-sensitivity B